MDADADADDDDDDAVIQSSIHHPLPQSHGAQTASLHSLHYLLLGKVHTDTTGGSLDALEQRRRAGWRTKNNLLC